MEEQTIILKSRSKKEQLELIEEKIEFLKDEKELLYKKANGIDDTIDFLEELYRMISENNV